MNGDRGAVSGENEVVSTAGDGQPLDNGDPSAAHPDHTGPDHQGSARGVVLITGATGGIGRALVHRYLQAGADVALLARSHDDLDALARSCREQYSSDVIVVRADLTAANAAQEVVESVEAQGRFIDVVINNAALGLGQGLTKLSAHEVRTTLDLNARAVTEMTHAVLPGMRARGHGSVVNISSMAGLIAMPSAPLYSATKAYLFNFTKALRSELSGTGVAVSVVASATVDTPMMYQLGLGRFAIFRAFTLQPETVADAIFQGQRAGRFLIVPGLANTIGTYFLRAISEPVASSLWGLGYRLTTRRKPPRTGAQAS